MNPPKTNSSLIQNFKFKLRKYCVFIKDLIEEVRGSTPLEQTPREDIDFVSSASHSIVLQNPKGARTILWATAVFIAVAIIWSSLAEIDQYTRGVGKVIPSRYLQVVQNLEGGILAEIYVTEGDQVDVSQPLVRIDDTLFSSSYREQSQKYAQLKIRIERLKAEASGENFVIDEAMREGITEELMQQELELFRSRQRELESTKEVLQEQLAQKQQQLEELQAKAKQVKRSYDLVHREVKLTKPLLAEGAISEVEVLRLEREANDLLGELESTELSLPRLVSQLDEAKRKLQSHILAFQSAAQSELSDTAAEYALLSESIQALDDRVQRTVVRSPVKGEVQRILVKTIGGVIKPGMDIMEIVPTDDQLVVEARVSPSDIAFLHPGQKAVVKITAYDYAVHGGLDGELIDISPDSIVDERGDSYFMIRVETDKTQLGAEENELPIIPGMTAEVEVLTGKKTVMQYLLNPVLRAKNRAMSER